jgi:hypothetical protein
MSNEHGDFIWYELMTSDADGAQWFYADVVGWGVLDSGNTDMDYRLFDAGDGRVGGMLQLSEEMRANGARPTWLGYIGVDDVDASVDSIVKVGGSVLMPATDVPNVGRLAMLVDPQGAPFYVMRGTSDETSTAFASDEPRPGHCGWNELATSDPAAAYAFYAEQFGWKKDGEMDLGAMGKYEFLRHGPLIGAIMPKPAEIPASAWTFYFRVPDIDAAAERVWSAGGRVVQGPHEVPGGDFVLNGVDPQGASFALVGARS